MNGQNKKFTGKKIKKITQQALWPDFHLHQYSFL